MIAPFPAGVSVKRVKDTFRSGNFMVVSEMHLTYHVALEHTSAPLVVKTLKDSLPSKDV
jgi:hypothetical protein